jgi:hypothetical protein
MGVVGMAAAALTQNWLYLALLAVAAAIGAARVFASRRTGVWH